MVTQELIDACLPQFVAAADWWVEQLRGLPGREAGWRKEDDPTGMAAALILTEALSAPVADDDQLLKFRDLLVERIAKNFRIGTERYSSECLYVDYGPDEILAKPAEEAGISTSRFPIKSGMWVSLGGTTAKLGYHGQHKILWPQPFADAVKKEFVKLTSDEYAIIDMVRKTVHSYEIAVRDRCENRTISKTANAVLGNDADDEAIHAAQALAELWNAREKIQCHAQVGDLRYGGCYDGHFYDKNGQHECQACGGRGFRLRSELAKASAQAARG